MLGIVTLLSSGEVDAGKLVVSSGLADTRGVVSRLELVVSSGLVESGVVGVGPSGGPVDEAPILLGPCV